MSVPSLTTLCIRELAHYQVTGSQVPIHSLPATNLIKLFNDRCSSKHEANVFLLTGRKFSINIEYKEKIASVKAKISQLIDFPSEGFRVFFRNTVLNPNQDLTDYGLKIGDPLKLFVSFKMGPCRQCGVDKSCVH